MTSRPPTSQAAENEDLAALSWRAMASVVLHQAWSLCVAYLGIGMLAEVSRRAGLSLGTSVLTFLDGMPIFALRLTGLLEWYLGAVAVGQLSPFSNRLLLSGLTVSAIFIQASLIGLAMMGLWRAVRRRRH